MITPPTNHDIEELKRILVVGGIAEQTDTLLPLNRGHSQLNYTLTSASSLSPYLFIKKFFTNESFEQTISAYNSLSSTQLALPFTAILKEQRVLIQPWHNGIALDQSKHHQDDKIQILASAMLRTHSHTVPLKPLSLVSLFKNATEEIRQSTLAHELNHFELDATLGSLKEIAQEPQALCHLDLSMSNVLFLEKEEGNAEVQIIDWEYAAQCQPIIDIGNTACIEQLSSSEINTFVMAYQRYRPINLTHLHTALDFSTLIASAWYLQKSSVFAEQKWLIEAQQLLAWRKELGFLSSDGME